MHKRFGRVKHFIAESLKSIDELQNVTLLPNVIIYYTFCEPLQSFINTFLANVLTFLLKENGQQNVELE